MTDKHHKMCDMNSVEEIIQNDREHIADVDGSMAFEADSHTNSQYYLEKSHKIVETILDEMSIELSEREDAVYQSIREIYAE